MASLSNSTRSVRSLRLSSILPNSSPIHRVATRPFQQPSRTSSPPSIVSPRPYVCHRCLHTTQSLNVNRAPKTRDRGPASKEDTQTDFGMLNVLGNTPPPASSIESTSDDGFTFDNQLKVSGSGVLLVGGEVFRWKPWILNGSGEGAGRKLLNGKGQWDVDQGAWGILDLVWPKPGMSLTM
jgi:NADH dehydrogenase [ubiquinone] 1 alpha subcomplex assembly factor 3